MKAYSVRKGWGRRGNRRFPYYKEYTPNIDGSNRIHTQNILSNHL